MLTVQDTVIWLRHILDEGLRARCEGLSAGQRLVLDIDGLSIEVEKMADGSDGRPTRGLKPVGASADLWRHYWPSRRGSRVPVREAHMPIAGFAEAVTPYLPPPRQAPKQDPVDLAWIEHELQDIASSEQDSVALLDLARARTPA